MTRRGAALVLGVVLSLTGPAQAEPLRILSLDQCADQYALALARPDDRLFLSPRADDSDSHLRVAAAGHPRVRPTLEAALVARPDVVIRYWGGEPRLLAALERGGVTIAGIDDAADFDGVRANVRRVAGVLGREDQGRLLVADMDERLARAASARASGSALYMTAGGFTAGDRTMVGAVFRAAGLRSLSPSPFFAPVSVERLLLEPPARFVLAFYDQVRADWRGPGRHPALRRLMGERTVTRLPAAVMGCPAWFAAEAAETLAAQAARASRP
ncbi:MAG: ABC transporter substrate-binding protein [Brevundimonas sp.]